MLARRLAPEDGALPVARYQPSGVVVAGIRREVRLRGMLLICLFSSYLLLAVQVYCYSAKGLVQVKPASEAELLLTSGAGLLLFC